MGRLDALRALLALPDPDDLPHRGHRPTHGGNKQKLQGWKTPTIGSERWIWRFLSEIKKPRAATAAHEQETK